MGIFDAVKEKVSWIGPGNEDLINKEYHQHRSRAVIADLKLQAELIGRVVILSVT